MRPTSLLRVSQAATLLDDEQREAGVAKSMHGAQCIAHQARAVRRIPARRLGVRCTIVSAQATSRPILGGIGRSYRRQPPPARCGCFGCSAGCKVS
jgi:hypothetical protein